MKVLITGTSRGIGRAAALKFLSEGFNVIGLDIYQACQRVYIGKFHH